MTLILFILFGFLFLRPAAAQNSNGLSKVSIYTLGDAAERGQVSGGFIVTRTEPFDQPLNVDYQILGTASNGVDYVRLPGRVAFAPGQAAALVVVKPEFDKVQEPPETVTLTLLPSTHPFTLAVLPDTQYYSAGVIGTPEMFTAQTRWLALQKDQLGLAFVLQVGDLTDGNTAPEWQRARESLRLLDGVVPYAFVPGNHDGCVGRANQTALFNQVFPATNYLTRPWFGGLFESNRMDNTYHLFSAGGVDWLVLALEFGPRDTVLAWANQVISSFPDRKVILISHAHVYADDTLHGSSANHLWMPTSYGRENNGTDVWESLLRLHPNTAFAFNGHVLLNGTGRVVGTNDFGHLVYQMLANYQMRPDGGGGFLRLVQFVPEQDLVSVRTYSPYLNAWLEDAQNQFVYTNLGVFAGVGPAYLIAGTNNAATLSIANDDLSHNPPDIVSVSHVGIPPVFTLTFDMPLEAASAEALTNYSLTGEVPFIAAVLAADQKTVQLTVASNLIEAQEYELSVSHLRNLARGVEMTNAVSRSFLYHALIMADDFSATNLAAYTVVDEGVVGAPSSWAIQGGRMIQSSNIYGPDGLAVDHRKGTFAFWNDSQAHAWTSYAVSVVFRNSDDDGAGLLFRYQDASNYYKVELDAQRSFRKLFKMVRGAETTLATENAGYLPGRDYTLRAMVTNNEIRVRLDGQLLFGGRVLDSSLSNGTVALYSWGSQGLSFSNLTVTPPFRLPLIAITSPSSGAVYQQLSPIPISVAATDPDGIVAGVEIFDGTNRLARLTAPPYRYEWATASPGVHTIIIKATDDTDLTGVRQVNVHVTPYALPPGWAQHPQSHVAWADTGVLFESRATGSGPLSYQWFYNGQPLPGASHRLLPLNEVHPDSAGSYFVTAANDSWSITSRVALLTVQEGTPSGRTNYPAGFQHLSVAGFDELNKPVLALETEPNLWVTVEGTSTLPANWLPILSQTNFTSPYYFSDQSPEATNTAARFYRALRNR